MELLIVLAVVAVVVFAMRSRRSLAVQGSRRASLGSGRSGGRSASPEELAAVRRATDEDITVFGEELQRLDNDLGGRTLDEGMRADYQRALDSYEAAKESSAAVTDPEQVRHVTAILEDGRYATACVRARVDGQPLPQRRPPCFFNPQHGPSVRDVTWSPPGGTTREVPACALDAQRVEAGAEPDSRQVLVGTQRVPYWQAGPAFAPWGAGYFGSFGLMEGLFLGTMIGGGFGGGFGGYDQGYDQGYGQGYDSGTDSGDGGGDGGGGFDSGGDLGGGGWDGGGGDFGGGDFGGF